MFRFTWNTNNPLREEGNNPHTVLYNGTFNFMGVADLYTLLSQSCHDLLAFGRETSKNVLNILARIGVKVQNSLPLPSR